MLRSGEVVPDWTCRHPSHPPHYDNDVCCNLCGAILDQTEIDCNEGYCDGCLAEQEEGLA